jgi:HK97 family phage portal protein
VEDYSNEFFENGVVLSGTVEVPEELSDKAYERLKREWKEQHTNKGSRHRAPVLEGGATFKGLALNHEEAQLLETRKLKRSTLAGILRVPAHFINDLEKATFSNVEHLDISFVKHSLTPWMTNWEQRCRMSLLTEEERTREQMEFAHDATKLLQGDFPSRMEGYGKAISNGVMSPNDARRKERMNPYKGGDVYLVQGALRDITKINEPVPAKATPAPVDPLS